MSVPLCICGHGKERHVQESFGGWPLGPAHCVDTCDCILFREVLDWPDAPGWWWFHRGSIVEARRENGQIIIARPRDWHWLADHEPRRFVRVLETNPFGDTQP